MFYLSMGGIVSSCSEATCVYFRILWNALSVPGGRSPVIIASNPCL